MSHSYDFHASLALLGRQDLDLLARRETMDAATKSRLFAQTLGNETLKESARNHYRKIVHTRDGSPNRYETGTLGLGMNLLQDMTLESPDPEEILHLLPFGSFAMQFRFELEKPYISRDDSAFHIIENPLRKEKVFKVPSISAASWKGNLRWTCMYTRLWLRADDASLSDPEFAEERLQQTLLFGTEQGMHDDSPQGWARHIDGLQVSAAGMYRDKLRRHFHVPAAEPLPHHAGRTTFFPTFLDRIDLEVINPHERETGRGTLPIYFETAPVGAKGTFTLVYAPLDILHLGEDYINSCSRMDFGTLREILVTMFRDYGFSAKKSSGFGVAKKTLKFGRFLRRGKTQAARFGSFEELLSLEWPN